MMFSTKTKVIFVSLISALTLSSGAYACSLDGWTSNTGAPNVQVGQPYGATGSDINGVSRVEEFCALQVSGTGHVETDAPSHTRVRGRLYMFPSAFSGSNDSNVLVAYDGGASELFSIAWNNGLWVVSATGGGSASTAATGGYDLIEFDWDPSGSGNLDVWVNLDATVPDVASISVSAGPTATLESIRVGLPDGLNGNSGTLFVDSVEMHNETAIGPLLIGDADANAVVDIFDYGAIQIDALGTLSSGTPDCNLDGSVDIFDYGCVQNVILGGG